MGIVIFFLLLFSSHPIGESTSKKLFAIWNVGQGQWITIKDHDNCFHFDAGGEFAPLQKISSLCRHQQNYIYLSHGDWDHINRLSFFRRQKIKHCLLNQVREPHLSRGKKAFIDSSPLCQSKSYDSNRIINTDINCKQSDKNNCYSFIFEWEKKYLIMGDSDSKTEKAWGHKVSPSVEIIILGHHGSATSSSEKFLKRLYNLNTAIASARYKRYRHPSKVVRARLMKLKIPLLTTETWGNIIIEL